MEMVAWHSRPSLRDPILVAAFEGWNDAGDAATTAASALLGDNGCQTVASIDSEEFYDFTSQRPMVRITDDGQRVIDWPSNEICAVVMPEAERDLVVLVGTEPHLRWRTYCEQVIDVAQQLGCTMVVTLGALLADIPHTRPVQLIGTSSDSDLIERYKLQRSRYEGPTGIVGVLNDFASKAGLPSLSLWAATPAYAPGTPSPKAAIALLDRCFDVIGFRNDRAVWALSDLASTYVSDIDAQLEGNDDLAEYVRQLETAFDDGRLGPEGDVDDDVDLTNDEDDDDGGDDTPTRPPLDPAAGADMLDQIEQFLRDQR
jgi:proteasome assembly chaperone (PAC2) family protein